MRQIDWRELRVDDRIRLTEVPPEYLVEGRGIHPETMRAYKKLVARRRPLRVCRVDDWGLPWVHFRFRRRNGKWEYHWLAVNHGGLSIVEPRQRSVR